MSAKSRIAISVALVALLASTAAFAVHSRLNTHAAPASNFNQVVGHGSHGPLQTRQTGPQKLINFKTLPDDTKNSGSDAALKLPQLAPVKRTTSNAPYYAPLPLPVAKTGGTTPSNAIANTPPVTASGGLNSSSGAYNQADPAIAVGYFYPGGTFHEYTVEAINSHIALYSINYSTFQLSYASGFKTLESFFGTADTIRMPRAFWDTHTGAYFVMAEDLTTSDYLVATATDPTGTWRITAIPNMGASSSQRLNFYGFDTPGFGFDSEAVYFTGNYYIGSGSPPTTPFSNFQESFIGWTCKQYLIDGTTGLCGNAGSTTSFYPDLVNDGSGTNPTYSVMPALSYGTPRAELFINTDVSPNNFSRTTNLYNVWSLSNPLALGGGVPTLSSVQFGNLTFATPPYATDPNLDNINDGYQVFTASPVWRNGIFYAAFESGAYNGTQNVGASLWFYFKVALANGVSCSRCDTVAAMYGLENGRFIYSGNTSAYYPSVAVDNNGDMCLTFNYSSSTVWPSMAMSCRRSTGTFGVSSQSVQVVAGSGPPSPALATYSWGLAFGDNTAIALDPSGYSDDTGSYCFLGVGEYTSSSGSTSWATYFGYSCYGIPYPSI